MDIFNHRPVCARCAVWVLFAQDGSAVPLSLESVWPVVTPVVIRTRSFLSSLPSWSNEKHFGVQAGGEVANTATCATTDTRQQLRTHHKMLLGPLGWLVNLCSFSYWLVGSWRLADIVSNLAI